MSIESARHDAIGIASGKPRRAPRRGMVLPLLVAAALGGAYELDIALRPPGEVIYHGLVAAGAEVERLSWSTPNGSVARRVARYFPAAYDATVNAGHFPVYVTVTLHNVDGAACLDARRAANRIAGQVVIELDEPTDETPCRDKTTMTWRILP